MGNLRDELLKKGLASKKRARAVAHEEKARHKKLGPEAVEAERRAREEAARREAEAQRAADREREEEARRDHERELEEDRIPSLIRAGLLRDESGGNRRFYFITRENTVSFLDVSDQAVRSLADGRIAIVESGGLARHDFCLVAGEQAAEIAKLDQDRVRFWNGGGRSGSQA